MQLKENSNDPRHCYILIFSAFPAHLELSYFFPFIFPRQIDRIHFLVRGAINTDRWTIATLLVVTSFSCYHSLPCYWFSLATDFYVLLFLSGCFNSFLFSDLFVFAFFRHFCYRNLAYLFIYLCCYKFSHNNI